MRLGLLPGFERGVTVVPYAPRLYGPAASPPRPCRTWRRARSPPSASPTIRCRCWRAACSWPAAGRCRARVASGWPPPRWPPPASGSPGPATPPRRRRSRPTPTCWRRWRARAPSPRPRPWRPPATGPGPGRPGWPRRRPPPTPSPPTGCSRCSASTSGTTTRRSTWPPAGCSGAPASRRRWAPRPGSAPRAASTSGPPRRWWRWRRARWRPASGWPRWPPPRPCWRCPAISRGLTARAVDAALAARRDHLPALRALRALARERGDKGAQVRAARRVLAYAPTDLEKARAHAELGELLLESDPPGARLHLDRALRLAPDDVESLSALARACTAAGEHLRAVGALDRLGALRLRAGDRAGAVDLALQAGRIWDEQLGHVENALLRYRDAAELGPRAAEAHRLAAGCAERLGRWTEAADHHAVGAGGARPDRAGGRGAGRGPPPGARRGGRAPPRRPDRRRHPPRGGPGHRPARRGPALQAGGAPPAAGAPRRAAPRPRPAGPAHRGGRPPRRAAG